MKVFRGLVTILLGSMLLGPIQSISTTTNPEKLERIIQKETGFSLDEEIGITYELEMKSQLGKMSDISTTLVGKEKVSFKINNKPFNKDCYHLHCNSKNLSKVLSLFVKADNIKYDVYSSTDDLLPLKTVEQHYLNGELCRSQTRYFDQEGITVYIYDKDVKTRETTGPYTYTVDKGPIQDPTWLAYYFRAKEFGSKQGYNYTTVVKAISDDFNKGLVENLTVGVFYNEENKWFLLKTSPVEYKYYYKNNQKKTLILATSPVDLGILGKLEISFVPVN